MLGAEHSSDTPATGNPTLFLPYLSRGDNCLTNRDACNSFRFCSYTNCRVSLPLACLFLKYYLNSPQLFSFFSAKISKFFLRVSSGLRTLLFYVALNSFVCHSYENCRGVPQSFPFWNLTFNKEVPESLLPGSPLLRSVLTSLPHYFITSSLLVLRGSAIIQGTISIEGFRGLRDEQR